LKWQDLKDNLRRAGNCKNCTIMTDEQTKKSKGYGQAVFETPMEALTCVALFNGFEMGRDRRAIVVRLVCVDFFFCCCLGLLVCLELSICTANFIQVYFK